MSSPLTSVYVEAKPAASPPLVELLSCHGNVERQELWCVARDYDRVGGQNSASAQRIGGDGVVSVVVHGNENAGRVNHDARRPIAGRNRCTDWGPDSTVRSDGEAVYGPWGRKAGAIDDIKIRVRGIDGDVDGQRCGRRTVRDCGCSSNLGKNSGARNRIHRNGQVYAVGHVEMRAARINRAEQR